MFYSLLEKGWCFILYPSSTTIKSKKKDTYVYIIVFSDFWWDKFFSKSIKLLSLMYQSNSCIEHMFFSIRLLSTRFLSLLTCLSLEFYGAFHFGFHPVWISSNFFVLFRMQWMLVTVNKARFSLRKTLETFSKISAMGCAVFKILSVHHEKHNSLVCWRTLLFPLKHMVCHVY